MSRGEKKNHASTTFVNQLLFNYIKLTVMAAGEIGAKQSGSVMMHNHHTLSKLHK
jgi:hypothetical protein